MRFTSLLVLASVAIATPVAQKGGGGGGAGRVHLIFARGTTELGTMGTTVGPALSSAMSRKFGAGFKSEGVSYPADISGAFSNGINFATSKAGGTMMNMAKKALSNGDKVVLSGYSQGAELVHSALVQMGPDAAKIAVS
jgi:cutinase